jgi:hypothetical protein
MEASSETKQGGGFEGKVGRIVWARFGRVASRGRRRKGEQRMCRRRGALTDGNAEVPAFRAGLFDVSGALGPIAPRDVPG